MKNTREMIDHEKLKLLIRLKGTNQRKIARMLGVSENTFSATMRRGTRMKLEDVCKIADYFGITIAELIRNGDGPESQEWKNYKSTITNTAEKMEISRISQMLFNLNNFGKVEVERQIKLLLEIPRFQKGDGDDNP